MNNIIVDIINWVKTKPAFWQTAVDKLIRNNELTAGDISQLTEICKTKNGLCNFEYEEVNFEELRTFAINLVGSDDIRLSKIYNINNINALSSTSILEFAMEGLTIIYGDNGSGKSSYTSVLKQTCSTRGKKPVINNNLYDSNSRDKEKKVDIEFTNGGSNFDTVNLTNSIISSPVLKAVDVFDSFSASHYVEEEDEIAFIPHGLAIIEKLATAIKEVETTLNQELQNPKLRRFDYSTIEVADNSNAKAFLQSLNHRTTLDELREVSNYSIEKEQRIEELRKNIISIQATDPKKVLKENQEKIARFRIIKLKIEQIENSLSGMFIENFKEKINTSIKASQALANFSNDVFSELPINGVGTNSWKLLWESARQFYNETIEEIKFPETTENSICPLCLQKLDRKAQKRFSDFELFVKDDIQKKYDVAFATINTDVQILNKLNLSFNEQIPTITEIESIIPNFSQVHNSYLDTLIGQKKYLLELVNSKTELIEITEIEIEKSSKKIVESAINMLEEANIKLATQSIEEILKPLTTELNQLLGEKKIFQFKSKLAREIFRQKKIQLISKCITECNTRTVTTFSNQLTTAYVTQGLKSSFKNELQKLGFKNIKIETETKGKKGKQYHYLRIDEDNANDIALKDILSEGEHRCISLATFLSEISIAEHKSAIIFDDPVSSLDHKWRYKIAKRIVEESKIRQVIVFTHDITFLLMIQELSNKLESCLEIKSLTRKKQETGIIASNPPWDALSVGKRIGVLKNARQGLEKIERTETEEVYNERAKLLYGKLRETWERFIEEVLLNSAIQRFGRSIQTQRLSKVVDLTIEDYNKVDANMSKCSTYFTGHDTAGELIEEMPNSSEFLSDIKVLEDYIAEIVNRRKRK